MLAICSEVHSLMLKVQLLAQVLKIGTRAQFCELVRVMCFLEVLFYCWSSRGVEVRVAEIKRRC